MFHTQGHGNRNCKPRRSRSLRWLKNGTAAGLSMMLLASCGGDGTNTAASNNNNVDAENIVRIGNGIGASFVEGQIGILQPNIESGGSTQLQINFVDAVGNAVTDVITVAISSNCIASSQSSIEGETDTSTGGLTLDYNTNGCTGEDLITATTVIPEGGTIQATGTVTIEEDAVLSVQFIPNEEPAHLALRGVGGTETATVKFRLVGQQSAPIVGEAITFSLNTEVGGVALAETTAESNGDGEVTAIVQSGTVHTTVVVTATHDATGIAGNSDGINISTGIAQANRFSLSAEVFNPRAFNLDGNEVGISIIVADQFGNPVPDNTVISFASPEGGTIPSSCATVDGRCSVSWVSSDPRPSDGRATIIAYTSGVEAFTDGNGNSIYDDSDNFVPFDPDFDLGEPFVDEDENSMYSIGEFFVDFNSSGVRDAADGVWNGPLCEHSSLCAPTADEVAISETLLLVMSTNGVDVTVDSSFPFPFPPVNGTIQLNAGATEFIQGVIVQDENGNAPAIGTTISFETTIGALEGTTEFDVGSRTEAVGPLGLVFAAPADPGTGRLIVKVEVPDVVTQEFGWNVDVVCPTPTNLAAGTLTDTSAILSWDEEGLATSWVVEYGLSGFVEGTGTTATTSNPHQLTGLTASTAYHYYVSAVCGGQNSASAGPFLFTTAP